MGTSSQFLRLPVHFPARLTCSPEHKQRKVLKDNSFHGTWRLWKPESVKLAQGAFLYFSPLLSRKTIFRASCGVLSWSSCFWLDALGSPTIIKFWSYTHLSTPQSLAQRQILTPNKYWMNEWMNVLKIKLWLQFQETIEAGLMTTTNTWKNIAKTDITW